MELNFAPSDGEKLLRFKARSKRLKLAIASEKAKDKPNNDTIESLSKELDEKLLFLRNFLED